MSNTHTIFFTGGTNGLGRAAVIDLLSQGHHVTLAARDLEKAASLKASVAPLKGELDLIHCDLNDLASIQQAIESFTSTHDHLDVLINNAGLWNKDFQRSQNGIEQTLQVNLIAPFMLMEGLLPLLKKSAGKVINTASALHQGDLQLDDLEFRSNFSGYKAYRQSKLGLILLTRWMAEGHENVDFYSVHPGVVSTSLGRNLGGLGNFFFKLAGISPEKGADTILHLERTSKEALESGAYYTKRAVKQTTATSYDMGLAEKLVTRLRAFVEKSAG
jgi:NAD(P)-dependent dehydrogenase (short-subunit alcohol dehydrogenase family)